MSSGGPPRDAASAPLLRAGSVDLARAVEALRHSGAVALPILDEELRMSLLAAARESRYRLARTLVGRGERLVQQRMEVCDEFPGDSVFHALTGAFQALWDDYLSGVSPSPFESRLRFNDLMLQRYSVGEVGITPHVDRTAYRNIVCLFVLEGRGRFCVCVDRAGNGAREIPHVAGDVLLMRAPGFLGSEERPFHFVRDIRSPRYVFGLRHERL